MRAPSTPSGICGRATRNVNDTAGSSTSTQTSVPKRMSRRPARVVARLVAARALGDARLAEPLGVAQRPVVERNAGAGLEAVQAARRDRDALVVDVAFMAHGRHDFAAADRPVEIAVEHRQRRARGALQLRHVGGDQAREIAEGRGLSGSQRAHEMRGEHADALRVRLADKAGRIAGERPLDRLGARIDRVEADQRRLLGRRARGERAGTLRGAGAAVVGPGSAAGTPSEEARTARVTLSPAERVTVPA